MEQFQEFPWLDLNFQKLTAIVAVLVVAVYIHIDTIARKVKKNGAPLPPGPRPWPIVGSLPLVGRLIHQDFAKLAKQYGPIMLMRLGSVPTIVVSSPQFAELFLNTHDKMFANRPDMTQGKIIAYDSQTTSLLPYGPQWRHSRKLLTLELFTARRMQQFQSTRIEEIMRTIHSILDDCKMGKPIRMDVKFEDLLENVMIRLINNKSNYYGSDSEASNLREHGLLSATVKDVQRAFGLVVVGDVIPLLKYFDFQGCKKEMLAVHKAFDSVLDGIIKEHQQRLLAQSKRPGGKNDVVDIVDVLLTRSSAVDEKPLTETKIKATLLETLTGGIDTSSNTLQWAMAELLRNPLILKRAQDELDNVVGKDRLVEESDLPCLHYLRAIVKETFRLHPVVPLLMPHELREAPCEVGGYYIPIKSRVYVNVWAIGRDPTIWDHALEFYPERFLTSNVDVVGKDFELLPFGSGRRSCPGRSLGLLMSQYTLAVLLHACDWTLPQGLSPEDVDLGEAPGITIPMATPLQAVATPRLSPQIIYADQQSSNRYVHMQSYSPEQSLALLFKSDMRSGECIVSDRDCANG